MVYKQKVAGSVVNWKQTTLDVTCCEETGNISTTPSWIISIATTTPSPFTAHALLATILVLVALLVCEARY